MMPHPENTVQDWQANKTGFRLFEGIAQSLAA